jgi:hypothetical protein
VTVGREGDNEMRGDLAVAMYVSALTAGLTALTFGLALRAVPISGVNCPGDCLEYPYLDTANRFPTDYVWMYPAMGLVLAYLLMFASMRAHAPVDRRIFGYMAVATAVVAAAILVPNYWVQSSVVPASIAAGETEGIALLTQYNPHGLFIALEEVGYLVMSISFLLAVPLVAGSGLRSRVVRWLFASGFIVPMAAVAVFTIMHGLDRQDRLEVVLIAVDWIVLIVNGILLALIFRSRLPATTPNP